MVCNPDSSLGYGSRQRPGAIEPGGGERGRDLPELLAPAGSWDCARAAVENGADAVYFGLDAFNARMRADNFRLEDLPELMGFLHGRGVRGYVTLNTLIFPGELPQVEGYLRSLMAAGVDAAIVQDVGLCRLIRHISPDFPIHGSTQMTVTSGAGVALAQGLGCDWVVLARECSLQDLRRIQEDLADRALAVPLEVFVHGALCVAYSGQCLTSESLGGRSANRGECAQACRMPYELVVDGQVWDLGDRRYLLSPQDLAGLEVLPDLLRLGITSLKIEGRLKAPEYVAAVTRVYRQGIDRWAEHLREQPPHNTAGISVPPDCPDRDSQNAQPSDPDRRHPDRRHPDSPLTHSPSPLPPPPDPQSYDRDRYDLEMAFSRGLYTGWFKGIDNQALVHGRFGKKRGVYLGEVVRVMGESAIVRAVAPIAPGDGVVFDRGQPDQPEQGGRIYDVETTAQGIRLTFGRGAIQWGQVRRGDLLWKTHDPQFDRRIRHTYTQPQPQTLCPLAFTVAGSLGQPLTVTATDSQGHTAQAQSQQPLILAHTQPLTVDRLRQQLGRLGQTPFYLDSLTVTLGEDCMIPLKELNRIRRDLVADLQAQRTRPRPWSVNPQRSWADLLPPPTPAASPPASELVVLVRDLEPLEPLLDMGIQTLYCELEDPRRYGEAVQRVRSWAEAHPQAPRPEIWVAPPRITKPKEHWILEQVHRSAADGYLVRNWDQLLFFQGDRCRGDFSLNVANPLTAAYFKQTFGLERLTASYDLNTQQLGDLLSQTPPHWLEVTIHQNMPMFHMEHCVFCAFLSEGRDFRDCGRPCDRHQVTLRDRVGTEHILQADAGCRNTLFNGVAQTGAESVAGLQALGLRQFRVEFLRQPVPQIRATVGLYQQLLQGTLLGSQLWQALKGQVTQSPIQNQLGVTRGTHQSSPSPKRG